METPCASGTIKLGSIAHYPAAHLGSRLATTMQSATNKEEGFEPVQVAIGIVARNEESGIGATLHSLFEQTVFGELDRRGWKCEILCLANGCTDRTAEVAAEIFDRQMRQHPDRRGFCARVVALSGRGKINAWNKFVHALSAKKARFLFLMDSDILIHRRETLWNMLHALENDAQAHIAVDRPCKDVVFKRRKSLWDRLSLAASRLTSSAEAQLCGQLYCIRAGIARNIYLPKDLAACEDGFIKTLVCTDFLTHPVEPQRIRLAEGAEHTFEAYASPAAIVKNQKRQIMGQTIVHILVDGYLKSRPPSERARLADTLQEKDRTDPGWLKRLIRQHLRQRRHWWHLYPGLSGLGFKRLGRLKLRERLACLLAAVASSSLALVSGPLAFEALKTGCTDYWPQAQRRGFDRPHPKL
jgi:glycosyltransferase involved in cell wall biosynthesis